MLSIENNRVSPDAVADLFESIASSNNGLLELRCAAQAQVRRFALELLNQRHKDIKAETLQHGSLHNQEAMGLRVEERIANAICKNPRIMKAGITLEFKEVITRVNITFTFYQLTT